MDKKPKNKGGRPKEDVADKVDFHQVRLLAGFNHTDVEIALILGISEMTLNRYKKDERFALALKKGKAFVDDRVIRSLYQRATGYKYTEKTFENIVFGNGTATKNVKVKTVVKHVEPNVTAQIFWLKNRRPQDWRDVKEGAGDKPPADQGAQLDKIIADAESRVERAGSTCH